MTTYRVQYVEIIHRVYEREIEAASEDVATDIMRDTYANDEPSHEFVGSSFIHEVEQL